MEYTLLTVKYLISTCNQQMPSLFNQLQKINLKEIFEQCKTRQSCSIEIRCGYNLKACNILLQQVPCYNLLQNMDKAKAIEFQCMENAIYLSALYTKNLRTGTDNIT